MPTVTLSTTASVIKDTYIDSGNPGAGYPTEGSLTVAKDSSGREYYGLIKFDLGLIPNNAIINSANINLLGSNPVAIPIAIHNITSVWYETTVTWNTRPTFEEQWTAVFNKAPGTGGASGANIKTAVQSWVNGDNNGILLKVGGGSTGAAGFYSADYSTISLRPTLTIDYSIPTEDKKQVEHVDFSSYPVTSSITHKVPLPAYVKGDLLLALVSSNSTEFDIPDGWTSLFNGFYFESGRKFGVVYRYANAFETEPVFTFSKAVYAGVTISSFRNVKRISATSNIVKMAIANVPLKLESIQLIDSNQMLLMVYAFTGDSTPLPPANFKLSYKNTSANLGIAMSETYNHRKTSYTDTELTTKLSTSTYVAGASIVLDPVTNAPPKIDGLDGYLGVYDSPLKKQYTVTDTEGDAVVITEKVNGVTLAIKNVVGTHTLDLSSVWDSLPLGKHTVTVSAADDYDPSRINVRTWTFLKTLPADAKTPEVVSGIGDLLPKFEALKASLVNKVGGNPLDSFEDILESGRFKKYAFGSVTGQAAKPGFVYGDGTVTSSACVTIDTSLIGFRPIAIVFNNVTKIEVKAFVWFDFEIYNNGTAYGNYQNTAQIPYRVPYVNGVMDFPIANAAYSYNWFAIGE